MLNPRNVLIMAIISGKLSAALRYRPPFGKCLSPTLVIVEVDVHVKLVHNDMHMSHESVWHVDWGVKL